MKDLTVFLDEFMEKTGYPEDSRDTFRDMNRKLLASSQTQERFDAINAQYLSDDPAPFFPDLDALGESLGIHKYTSELFFFMYQKELERPLCDA